MRRLPEGVVNRIAAGEVVERPAAAVKELVENALDAGAGHVRVRLRDGGKARLRVSDDGRGMTPDELRLAVERHCTSKLTDDALVDIATLGFRGEALPSIGAVAHLTVTSRPPEASEAWAITVDGGAVHAPQPAALGAGTQVTVRDLFQATPARLNFLKRARTETQHVLDTVQRLAMAHPGTTFRVTDDERTLLRLDGHADALFGHHLDRLAAVLGREFKANCVPVDAARDELRLYGYAGLPTFTRANAQGQHLFVNGRPVKDRLLQGAVRGAYRDLMGRDRHPVVALFLDCPPDAVDVNVHPTKAEVRFREADRVRALIVSALQHALAGAGHRAADTGREAALAAARPHAAPPTGPPASPAAPAPGMAERAVAYNAPLGEMTLPGADSGPGARADATPSPDAGTAQADTAGESYPLGAARAQLHETYIVAQTAEGLVIVDQHAAHERLVHERMKRALHDRGVARQGLLIPEVVELDPAAAERLGARADELAALGLTIETFGEGAVVVREVPALLGETDVQGLIRDLADELASWRAADALTDRLERVCATLACHGSVRAGRRLSVDEMNALLRQMEADAFTGQCNHGRPTYVALHRADIEHLFGRH